MAKQPQNVKGPLGVRMLIWAGSFFLALLFIWGIGYALQDVGRYRIVDWDEVREKHVPEELDEQVRQVEMQLEDRQREIQHVQEHLNLTEQDLKGTRDATMQMQDSEVLDMLQERDTTGQFLELIAESQRSFQEATRRRHELVNEMQSLQNKRQALENQLTELRREVEKKEKAAHKEHDAERRRRNLIAGVLKLLVLLPFVLVAAWVFMTQRGSRFAPIAYAFGAAVLWHLVFTITEHFPRAVYKYILIVPAIVCVIYILRKLIQSIWKPAKDTLHRRYRQAYEKNECGVCGYPIRWKLAQVSARELTGSRRGSVMLSADSILPQDQTYTCPSCGTTLYEKCSECGNVRHSLLPGCRHCGAEKEITGPES